MKNTKIFKANIIFNKEFDTCKDDKIEINYYKTYVGRYSQVYKNGMFLSSKENTPEVLKCIKKYKINKMDKILDLGCGEGGDSIYLLDLCIK